MCLWGEGGLIVLKFVLGGIPRHRFDNLQHKPPPRHRDDKAVIESAAADSKKAKQIIPLADFRFSATFPSRRK